MVVGGIDALIAKHWEVCCGKEELQSFNRLVRLAISSMRCAHTHRSFRLLGRLRAYWALSWMNSRCAYCVSYIGTVPYKSLTSYAPENMTCIGSTVLLALCSHIFNLKSAKHSTSKQLQI